MVNRPSVRSSLQDRFRRPAGSVSYLPEIDGLRALALLLVIGHHVFAIYLEQTNRLGTHSLPQDWPTIATRSSLVLWGRHLAFGVPMFFVISGFVLALPFARALLAGEHTPTVSRYLLRRLIRLEPPYLISMTIFFVAIVAPWAAPIWHDRVMLAIFGPHYLASIVYLHALVFGEPSWLGGIAWTLEIEVQFYLLMPLLAQVFRLQKTVTRRAVLMSATLGASLFAQRILPMLHSPRWQLTLAGHLGFFLAGVLLADLYLQPSPEPWMRKHGADLGAAASAALLIYVLHRQPAFTSLEPLLVLAMYYCVLQAQWVAAIFRLPWLTAVGAMCYTVYLYHFNLVRLWIHFAGRFVPQTRSLLFDSALQMLLSMPVILLVSAMLYLAVERPCIVLSHRVTSRRGPPEHDPGGTAATEAPAG